MWQSILVTSVVLIGFIVVFSLLYYLLTFKGLKKRREMFKKVQAELKIGNYVSLSSGIFGTVEQIEKETLDLKVKSGAIITVSRFMVSEIIK